MVEDKNISDILSKEELKKFLHDIRTPLSVVHNFVKSGGDVTLEKREQFREMAVSNLNKLKTHLNSFEDRVNSKCS